MHSILKLMEQNELSRTKFIALNAFINKSVRSHTSNLTAYLEALKQKEASTSKKSRRREIIKFRAEIVRIKTKRTIQRINETSWFCEKSNKIDKPLSKVTKKQKQDIQIKKKKFGT